MQALVQNDGSAADLVQGTPVHVHLAPDALRVLTGDYEPEDEGERGSQRLAPAVDGFHER